MKTIKLKIVCHACVGTGLYSGMAEGHGAAVVCHRCNGTGCYDYEFDYEDFVERKPARGIKRVYETNPGIGIGEGTTKNGTCHLEEFGGIPYEDWIKRNPFPKGSEMRKYTCPAWWYQSVDYTKKPTWDECIRAGGFSSCKHFKKKDKCWERFDKENPEKDVE